MAEEEGRYQSRGVEVKGPCELGGARAGQGVWRREREGIWLAHVGGRMCGSGEANGADMGDWLVLWGSCAM